MAALEATAVRDVAVPHTEGGGNSDRSEPEVRGINRGRVGGRSEPSTADRKGLEGGGCGRGGDVYVTVGGAEERLWNP